MQSLYDLGARKFGIISVSPIGCCPLLRNATDCDTEANHYAQSFYSVTENMLKNLSSELPGMVYSLGDMFNMTMLVLQDQLAFGK